MVFSCDRVGEGFAAAYFMCKARTRDLYQIEQLTAPWSEIHYLWQDTAGMHGTCTKILRLWIHQKHYLATLVGNERLGSPVRETDFLQGVITLGKSQIIVPTCYVQSKRRRETCQPNSQPLLSHNIVLLRWRQSRQRNRRGMVTLKRAFRSTG